MMVRHSLQSGYTLVELVISMAIAALLLTGLQQLLGSGMAVMEHADERTDLARQARFAMARMTDAVRLSERILIPMANDPATPFDENVREQTVPASPPQSGSLFDSAVLAVTLSSTQDMDANGIADADNDGDGRLDEDLPADTENDGASGIRGIDDDGNGLADFLLSSAGDDDETILLASDEDPVNGLDDDGDGKIDEDPGADNNGDSAPGIAGVDDDGDGSIDEGDIADDDEDGESDEDWYDPVVFYLSDSTLVERRPVPWDENADGAVDGRDVVESALADNVTLLRFERLTPSLAGQKQLVDVTLTLAEASGETISLNTRVRVGASR